MDLLGEHFGTQKRFSDQSPTRWAPNESFFPVFEWIFDDIFDEFLVLFLTSRFLLKNLDFLKIAVLLKREHRF